MVFREKIKAWRSLRLEASSPHVKRPCAQARIFSGTRTGKLLPLPCAFLLIAAFLDAASVCAQPVADQFRQAAEFYSAGRPQKALPILEEILRREPRHTDAALLLGQMYFDAKNFDASAKILGDALRNRADARLHAALGRVCLAQSRFADAVRSLRRALEMKPGDGRAKEILSVALDNLGVQEYREGGTREAEAHLREAAALDGRNVSARKNLALLHASGKRYREAEKELAAALRLSKKDAELLKILLRVEEKLRDFAKAEAAAEKLCLLEPAEADACLEYAYLLRFNGRWEASRQVYRDLASRFPKDKRIPLACADLYTARGEHDSALAELLAYSNRVPEERGVFADIARLFAERGKREDARFYYRRAMTGGAGDAALYLRIAELYEKEERHSESAALLREGCVRFPADLRIPMSLGALYEKLDPVAAAALYRNLRAEFKDDAGIEVRLGEVCFRTDSLPAAVRCFESAIGKKTLDPIPHRRLAQWHRSRGDTAEALLHSRAAVRLAMDRMQALEVNLMASAGGGGFGAGFSAGDSLESIARARETTEALLREALDDLLEGDAPAGFEAFLASLPGSQADAAIAREYRARSYERSGKNTEALAEFAAILKRNPKYTPAHRGVARIREGEGDAVEAMRAWRRVQSIDPRDSLVYASLIRLARRTGSVPDLLEDWMAQARSGRTNLPLLKALRALAAEAGREEIRSRADELILGAGKEDR